MDYSRFPSGFYVTQRNSLRFEGNIVLRGLNPTTKTRHLPNYFLILPPFPPHENTPLGIFHWKIHLLWISENPKPPVEWSRGTPNKFPLSQYYASVDVSSRSVNALFGHTKMFLAVSHSSSSVGHRSQCRRTYSPSLNS